MKLNQYWFWQLPSSLTADIYVIFDIWAATTNLPLILNQHPQTLILTSEATLAKTRSLYPKSILVGESTTKPIDFDVPNYPNKISQANFNHQAVIYTTTNGTKIFQSLESAPLVIACSFNNAQSVAHFILDNQFRQVDLLMAGDRGQKNIEDKLGADYLKSLLTNKDPHWHEISTTITKLFSTQYYSQEPLAKGDHQIILQPNRYSIIPACRQTKNGSLEIYNLINS